MKSSAVFKAPDGREFSNKADFRDYMIENFLSFKEKHNIDETLIKGDGQVNGQPFEIANCSNSSLALLDLSDQVQIDNVSSSRIFIGACNGSLFIRECENSIFYVCAKQIRLRNVSNCKFFSLTPSEIHIELSSDIEVAPFLGGYSTQEKHLGLAGIDVMVNRWYDVYDHNDPSKTGKNWKKMTEEEYVPWFPDGSTRQCVPISNANSHSSLTTGQVGESFGLDQMIKDSKNTNNSLNIPSALEQLDSELAILIASSSAKGIDPLLFLAPNADHSKRDKILVYFTDFEERIKEIAEMVGRDEDAATKEDLRKAVSALSLRVVSGICGEKLDSKLAINIRSFLDLCEKKVEMILENETSNNEEVEVDEDDAVDQLHDHHNAHHQSLINNARNDDSLRDSLDSTSTPEFSLKPIRISATKKSSTGMESNRYGTSSSSEIETNDYIEELRSFANPMIQRPGSAPSGDLRPLHAFGATSAATGVSNSPQRASTSTSDSLLCPNSPYDEIVSFEPRQSHRIREDLVNGGDKGGEDQEKDVDDEEVDEEDYHDDQVEEEEDEEDELDTLEYEKLSHRGSPIHRSHNQHHNSNNNNNSNSSSSGGNILFPEETQDVVHSKFKRSGHSSGIPGIPIHVSQSMEIPGRFSSSSSKRPRSADPRLRSSMPGLVADNDDITLVEMLVSGVVKKADSYHKLQVSLGFLDDFIMIPARGAVIQSKPRPWLSYRDIYDAFLTCGLRFQDQHVSQLMQLIKRYATDFRHSLQEKALSESMGTLPKLGSIISKNRVDAQWTKKYLAHLRLKVRGLEGGKTMAEYLLQRSRSQSAERHRHNLSQSDRVKTASFALSQSHTTIHRSYEKSNSNLLKYGILRNSHSSSNHDYHGNAFGGPSTSRSVDGLWRSSQEFRHSKDNYPSPGDSSSSSPLLYQSASPNSPLVWEEWLEKKMVDDKKKLGEKPQEFRHLLAGEIHELSSEEVEEMLQKYQIIPESILKEEIQFRIDSWVNDHSGRRDFQHCLYGKTHGWEKKTGCRLKDLTMEARKSLLGQLKKELIAERTQELQQGEEKSLLITHELFGKYVEVCQDIFKEKERQGEPCRITSTSRTSCGVSWASWLKSYRSKCEQNFHALQETLKNIRRAVASKSSRRQEVAAVADIEKTLSKASQSLPSKSTELRKNFLALRKAAAEAGLGRGKLVSRAQFDYFFENVLTPSDMKLLPTEIKEMLRSGTSSSDGPSSSASAVEDKKVFHREKKEAEARVLEYENALKANKSYDEWLKKKRSEERNKKRNEEDKKVQEQKEEESRLKRNKKAYNQWLKLRKSNLYKSRTDGHLHSLPQPLGFNQSKSWNKELDISNYYRNQDKEY